MSSDPFKDHQIQQEIHDTRYRLGLALGALIVLRSQWADEMSSDQLDRIDEVIKEARGA